MDEMMLARLLHFYFGLLVFVQNPVLGVGINSHVQYMTANFNFRSLGEINLVYDTFLFYYPVHNIWIIWLAEFGVLGTLLVIAFFVYKFLKIKPTLRSNIICENKIAAMTSIGVICCFLVQGMADPSHLSMHLSQVWMLFFLLSTAPHCRISLPDEKEENPPPLPHNK
jgi:O-antigen ligase